MYFYKESINNKIIELIVGYVLDEIWVLNLIELYRVKIKKIKIVNEI